MKRIRWRIFALSCALLSMTILFAMYPAYNMASPSVEAIRARIRDEGVIIHAGGSLKTHNGEVVSYTNSYDALLNMYNLGHRICEIDIGETSDGVLICAHSIDGYLTIGSDLPVTATSQEFLNERIFGEFEPMTVDMLAAFMREHEDLLIVTDVKDSNEVVCQKIATDYPDLTDRFIIQVYHNSEYDQIRSLGFPYIIYTFYRATDEEYNFWNLKRFAEQHELIGMTFNALHYTSPVRRYAMARAGVPLMFHTLNDPNEIAQFQRGINVVAVYTDIV